MKLGLFRDSPPLRIRRTNPPLLFLCLGAFFTMTPWSISSLLETGIHLGVRMPLRAVGFIAVSIRSAKVFPTADWFQMDRIYTFLYAAKMVNVQSSRNFTTQKLISEAVGLNFPLCDAKGAIPFLSLVAGPNNTGTQIRARWWNWSWFSLFRKPQQQGFRLYPLFPVPKMSPMTTNHRTPQ